MKCDGGPRPGLGGMCPGCGDNHCEVHARMRRAELGLAQPLDDDAPDFVVGSIGLVGLGSAIERHVRHAEAMVAAGHVFKDVKPRKGATKPIGEGADISPFKDET